MKLKHFWLILKENQSRGTNGEKTEDGSKRWPYLHDCTLTLPPKKFIQLYFLEGLWGLLLNLLIMHKENLNLRNYKSNYN